MSLFSSQYRYYNKHMITNIFISRNLFIVILSYCYWAIAFRQKRSILFSPGWRYNQISTTQSRQSSQKIYTSSLSSYDPLEIQGMLRQLNSRAKCEKSGDRRILPLQERILVLQRFNSECIEASEPKLLADCIWHIGSLGFSVHTDEGLLDGPNSLVPRVLTRVNIVLRDSPDPRKTMDSVAISKLFIGLARLQVSLKQSDIRKIDRKDEGVENFDTDNPFVLLVEIFKTSLPFIGAQSLSNALWALSQMGVRRSHLSPTLRREVLSVIHELSPEFTDQALSMVLWSLFKLGYTWPRIPEAVQSSLLLSMGKLCVRMSSQAVGNSLFALGRMGLRFEDLSESSRVALEIAVRHSMDLAHDQDFMQIVQGLALMQVPWTTLSVQTRHSLSMTLFTRAKTWLQRGSFGSVVEYATLLQSLGGLGVRWTDCDPALRAGLLLGLTAVTDLSGGANSTDPAAAHLSSDKDSFVKIEKLKYGVLQNLASRALNNTRSSNLSGNVDQTMESTTTNQLPVPASDSPHTDSELRYVYALAIPNIWRSLADLEISLVEDASAQVNEQLSSRVAVSSIPAPISRRFFTLTAVFASDFSLQGLSMLSTSLISLSVNSKSSSSSSVKRKPNMIPRVLSEELTKRLILLLEQHVQSSADIVDEESQRSVANIVTCAGKLEFLQFEERNMKKRFQTNLQLFYERQYKHHLNYSIGENTTDLILVPLAVESSVSTTRNLESILATLNGVVAMKSKYNWENAPLELKQATWSGLSDCLQSARSASLSKQLIVELELAASIICTLGNLGVDWKSLMSHVSFVRSRRLRQQPTITQEQTDISQTTHSSEIPLLLSLVETCQDIVERYLSTNLNSSEGQEEASRLVVLLLRALNGIGYLGNTVDATNNTVNAINNIRSLPTTSDLVMLLLKVFTTNRSDDVGLFTSALYHLGKIQSQAFESEPLPQAQMSKLTSLASQLLIRHFDKISYQVLANVFTGLKGLRVRWDVLPHSLQSVCLVRLAYLAATQLTGEGSTGVVACVSALAAIDMLGSQVSRNDTNENIKAHHSLVMQSGSPPGALSNELAHSQSLRAYLHSNLHRYILRQVANTVDSFSALECRLLLRACCSLQWTTHMSKSLKLLLLQIISDEMQNSITSRLVESRKFTRRLVKYDGDLFSPLAFVKLCVDIGGISWIDLPISLRSKLLISAVDFALLKKDHPDSATYSQFRSFLHRLESLGATWTTLAGVHSSLPFERFLVTEIRRFLCSSSDYRLTNSSPPSTRRHADDSNRFEPKYDFRVATEMLDWTVRMNCRHTDFLQFESVAPGSALSDNLIQTACDAVLSIPKFALLTSQTTEKMQIEDMASEDRALIKFSALLDMLLAFDIQWLSLGQTGQRALIRLMHLAVLLALRDVGSKTTPANSVTENTSMSLFDRAVQLLFFLRIKWSDLPTRPRNLLSSALAEVMLKHQEKVIALLALQNRQVSTSMLESPEVSTVALEEAELQKTVNFLGDMVHIVQMILRHLQVSNQTATKELRQFL